jgi:hypothetical protein
MIVTRQVWVRKPQNERFSFGPNGGLADGSRVLVSHGVVLPFFGAKLRGNRCS